MESQFLLIFQDYSKLEQNLAAYKNIQVFFDESTTFDMRKKLLAIFSNNKNITTIIAPCFATEKFCSSIPFSGADFVICVGKLHLQSVVKYYAYQNNIGYAIIPVQEVSEYSFSKYAFIKDDKFSFYVCDKPTFAFIIDELFTCEQVENLYKILTYKNIVVYEKEFEKLILDQPEFNINSIVQKINCCNGNLKEVVKIYATLGLYLNKYKTKNLGCEYTVLSLLANNQQDISFNLLCITNLLTRFYECLNKFNLISVLPNVNLHAYYIKKEYNIGVLNLVGTIMPLYNNKEIKRITYTINAYLPHLKLTFFNAKNFFKFSKVSFNSKQLELSLALCAGTNGKNNMLRFARDFGYFENLLK